jgi:hypothetical protein
MRILFLLLLLTAISPARLRAEDVPVLPAADSILAGVIGALPDIPLLVNADLQSRTKDGKLERRMNVEMLLDWQMDPPGARYTLRDTFGATLNHLALSWPTGGPAEYRFFTGNPLQAAALPNLAEPIEGTDIAWMDLSLAFLWWPGGITRGEEEVKGRMCYVMDIPAPAEVFSGCSGVRVWIDPRINILLRAEAYGLDDQRQRRLEVKSFRKINDRWFIKDIEIQSYPSRHKTILRVRDVQDRERKEYLDREGGAAEPAAGDAPPPEVVEPVEPVPVD